MFPRFPWIVLAVIGIAAALLTGCASSSQRFCVGATQHGDASWYGSENGSRTASGERFNPRELTAAHRRFPFGTMVRVTNEENGRSVEVRINDRGPWTGGRIIDLSSAAADEIDMKRAGVVPVTLEIIEVGSGPACR
jgi:rare lipoprotein A